MISNLFEFYFSLPYDYGNKPGTKENKNYTFLFSFKSL